MDNKGFTLVELIAVIAILGLLAIITTPAYDIVSKNIKTRNYESKKNVIKAHTIEYVENYLKDVTYNGTDSKSLCFSPRFLIQNGIISSDDDKKEYIKNDVSGEKYQGENAYIEISYDKNIRKLKSIFVDENNFSCGTCTSNCVKYN